MKAIGMALPCISGVHYGEELKNTSVVAKVAQMTAA